MFVCSRHFLSGKPAYEFMEADPDWVPSLHLGLTEVKAPTTELFAHRTKRQPTTRGENSAPAASQDVTGQIADMNETALNVEVDGAEQRSEVDEKEQQECRLCSQSCA
ncbi:hypothetical protein AMECASPLE_021175 [Ameca splendens]|uniref:THAP-type domain-containing protein n=1 Tax=Ameca splendens TaxID=208324 RepID=A0ABV0ZCB0_9TELE